MIGIAPIYMIWAEGHKFFPMGFPLCMLSDNLNYDRL